MGQIDVEVIVPAGLEQDVLGLEVAVHHPDRVYVIERADQLADVEPRGVPGEGSTKHACVRGAPSMHA